jgi:filamentous hemagglutinin
VNNILNQQADQMQAAQAAGQAVAQRIGDYANAQEKATGDPEWAEGGNKRAAMQAAGAAIVAGLGGGAISAVEGAAGAAIGSKMAGSLNQLSNSIAGSNPTGDANLNQALGNIVANVIATGAGAVAGGAGSFSSSDVDRYNRQLHPEEKQVIKQLAGGDTAKELRLEAAACALVQCAAEYAPGTADYAKYSALQIEGAAYTAEQDQLRNYAGTLFSAGTYGGMVRPTSGTNLFTYSGGDALADQKASQAAIGAMRPGSIDYVTLQAGAGMGGSTTINMHNGNVYAGASVSASRETGVGIIFGMIPDSVGRTADQKAKETDNLLQGQSVGGNGCLFGVCAGLNHAVGGSTAIEVGFGVGGVTKAPNPGGNGSWGYSDQIFTIPGVGNAKR